MTVREPVDFPDPEELQREQTARLRSSPDALIVMGIIREEAVRQKTTAVVLHIGALNDALGILGDQNSPRLKRAMNIACRQRFELSYGNVRTFGSLAGEWRYSVESRAYFCLVSPSVGIAPCKAYGLECGTPACRCGALIEVFL